MDYIKQNNIAQNSFCFSIDEKPVRAEFAEAVFRKALVKCGIAKSIDKMKDEGIYKKGKITDRSELIPGGRKLVPHSLRYTYVTRMRRELPVDTVRKMVGHSSIEMTDYYTNKAALDEAIDGLKGASGAADNLFV
jgi:integrase